MIEKQKTIYYCEHCKKMYLSKYWCEKHELDCRNNHKNYRHCFEWCKNLTKKELTTFVDTYQGEIERKVEVFFCKKLNKALYPPDVERKKNMFSYLQDKNEEVPNERMPIKCDFYEY